jgi:structural maintenance of chromosome 4
VAKLTKGVEESKKERDKLAESKEKAMSDFKDIQEMAFTVQEKYHKTQEVLFSSLLLGTLIVESDLNFKHNFFI